MHRLADFQRGCYTRGGGGPRGVFTFCPQLHLQCVKDVTTTRTVVTHTNQKPWLNAEVRSLLKARDAAFRSGDAPALTAGRRQLTGGIRRAKDANAQRIQRHFSTNDPRSMGKGIKCITDYTCRGAQCPRDPALPDALNQFENSTSSPSTRLGGGDQEKRPSV